METESSDLLESIWAELEPGLRSQRQELSPISSEERSRRRRRLGSLLQEAGIDALLTEPSATMEYLSGVSWGRSERLFGLVVFADGSCSWIAPSFEVSRAEQKIEAAFGAAPDAGSILGWDEHEYPYRPLAALLKERRVERLAVEPETRLFIVERLEEAFGKALSVSGTPIVRELRGRKDEHELALLRRANELTQQALRAVAPALRPGLSDMQLGTLMRRAQEQLGLENIWVLPLIGPDAAYPHGSPTGRSLNPGDLVLVDTGGSLHGYQSDNTRTWVFDGQPSAEIERGWNTVRDAQKKAFATLRAGTPCREVDRAARGVIEAAGFGQGYTAFGHRLGHGIGMQVHEEPYLDGGNDLVLAPGMTFSDEPGIYLPGRFGIRIEDIVAVTDGEADHFGTWQASPLAP